tara:strand:+ start:178 stop:462 length:285 start_codon:yes stop_codon:yes gene_type:complete
MQKNMNEHLTLDLIFNNGPFADNSKRLSRFGTGLYFAYLFDDSLKRHQELEKEYKDALLENDSELADMRRNELEMMEGIYKVSFSLFESNEIIS